VTRYRTIVADPPWPFKWQGAPGGRRRNASTLGYETMTVAEIIALGQGHGAVSLRVPVDGTLLLWTTQEMLHSGAAQRVAVEWGFTARVGELVWRKRNFGMGAYPRMSHETCLIYRCGRGSLRVDAPRDVHSVQTWKQPHDGANGKKHSAKPDGFYDFVEAGFEGPYLEMFARRARFGWDYWGDQSLGTAAFNERALVGAAASAPGDAS
jgi:N6-adenosine-specific RNA methylase IME4